MPFSQGQAARAATRRKWKAALSLAAILHLQATPLVLAATTNVDDGQTATGGILDNGDTQNVNSGGVANGATLEGGKIWLYDGGALGGSLSVRKPSAIDMETGGSASLSSLAFYLR